jgi:hypothetical protein
MTNKQKAIAIFLESLVGTRTTKQKLNTLLSIAFNEPIKVENITKKDDELPDYNLLFGSEKKETYGYFDIYYLKMRCKGFDNANIYITEVGYEFE